MQISPVKGVSGARLLKSPWGCWFVQTVSFALPLALWAKVYEGYWRFPGGKLESGESVGQALRRELREEIGITIAAVHPWKIEMVDYPHARWFGSTFAKCLNGRASCR